MSSHSQFSQSLGGPCFNLQVWSLFWINKRSMMTKGGERGVYLLSCWAKNNVGNHVERAYHESQSTLFTISPSISFPKEREKKTESTQDYYTCCYITEGFLSNTVYACALEQKHYIKIEWLFFQWFLVGYSGRHILVVWQQLWLLLKGARCVSSLQL